MSETKSERPPLAGAGIQSRLPSLSEQEGTLLSPGGDERSACSSGGRVQGGLSEYDKQVVVDKELLQGIIHEVGTALTIIQLYATLLELKISKETTVLDSLQRAEQRCDGEEDSVRKIIRQVQRIETLMATIADTIRLPKNGPHVPS